MSFRTTLSLLLSTLLSLTQCRIYSGQLFQAGTQVDVTCHGDSLGFDGSLFIIHKATAAVVYTNSIPPDANAVLTFQNDGELHVIVIWVFDLTLASAGNLVISGSQKIYWHTGFSDPSRGPFVGDLQLDLVSMVKRRDCPN